LIQRIAFCGKTRSWESCCWHDRPKTSSQAVAKSMRMFTVARRTVLEEAQMAVHCRQQVIRMMHLIISFAWLCSIRSAKSHPYQNDCLVQDLHVKLAAFVMLALLTEGVCKAWFCKAPELLPGLLGLFASLRARLTALVPKCSDKGLHSLPRDSAQPAVGAPLK